MLKAVIAGDGETVGDDQNALTLSWKKPLDNGKCMSCHTSRTVENIKHTHTLAADREKETSVTCVTGMTGVTCVTDVTGMTGLTGMTYMTGVTGMTGVISIISVTGMIGATGMTEIASITGKQV